MTVSRYRRTALTAALVASGAVLASLATGVQPARAVVTSTWMVDTFKQWDEGEASSAYITSQGEVKPGWATSKTELTFSGVWAAVRGGDGTVYVGSDDDGAVYAVRGGKVKKLAAIDGAIAVVSLAVAGDGTLYAGTMPKGEVWKIAPGGKASRVVAIKGAETVWGLALSGGALYAGTGPDGALHRIDVASGKSSSVFETGDKRVLAVVAGDDDSVWLATSEEAIVYRYSPKQKTARAMADFDANEVTALAAYNGGVIATVNTFKEDSSSSGPRSSGAASKGTKAGKREAGEKPDTAEKDEPGAEGETPANAKLPRPGARKGSGALYRIDADGGLTQLHALKSTYYASVAVTDKGQVLAGAGDKGRVYLIEPDETVSTAFDVPERVVVALLPKASGLTFATADGAAFYDTTGRASKASYTSKVFDAEAAARFGKLVWHGNGKLAIDTRTGNTAKPGKGWSKWQTPSKPGKLGGNAMGAQVTSPPGRFFQYRVRFEGDSSASVSTTRLYYLPNNKPTTIESIELDDDDKKKKKLATVRSGATKPRSPVIKVTWKVDNDDGDETVYDVEVRSEGAALWRPLPVGDEPLTKAELEWNTETFPDGHYRLRVRANDRRGNVTGRALEHEKTTELFVVDNGKPGLGGVAVRYPAATARATDSMSPIAEAAYAVDDGEWILAAPQDGLYDDLSELLSMNLPADLAPGPHTLSIRVADEAGNIGSASITFRIGN